MSDNAMKTDCAPLFSVVIPLYNKADVIRSTLKSVGTQTFRDFEVVVIDDGSTDGGEKVAKETLCFLGVPFRIISQANAGVSAARNRGAKESIGRYIALLDGDDIWFPNHLEVVAKAIEQFPDAGLIGSGYEWGSTTACYRTRERARPYVCDLYHEYTYVQPMHTSSTVIRKDVFEAVGGFDPQHGFFEDVEFFFKVAEKHICCLTGAVTERYETAAGCRLTVEHIRFSPRELKAPHLEFLEDLCVRGIATDSMCEYLTAEILWRLAMSIRTSDDEMFERIRERFPHGFALNRRQIALMRVPVVGEWVLLMYRAFRRFQRLKCVRRGN